MRRHVTRAKHAQQNVNRVRLSHTPPLSLSLYVAKFTVEFGEALLTPSVEAPAFATSPQPDRDLTKKISARVWHIQLDHG